MTSNKYLKQIVAVSLVLLIASIVILKVRTSEYDSFLSDDFQRNSQFNSPNSTLFSSTSNFSETKLPRYKGRKYESADVELSSNIDFPTLKKSTDDELNKHTDENARVEVYRRNNDDYKYSLAQHNSNYSSENQSVISQKNSFSTNKSIIPTNNMILSGSILGVRTQPISNTSSNSFLANNTLSFSTDISDNNSPMLVGGDSNPGDPAVPVGDGIWLLMSLLVAYGVVLSYKRKNIITQTNR